MARKSRIDAPGALHHIIVRGIDRQSIFIDTQDYQNFLGRLGNILMDSSTACYAWALMTNHAQYSFKSHPRRNCSGFKGIKILPPMRACRFNGTDRSQLAGYAIYFETIRCISEIGQAILCSIYLKRDIRWKKA